MAARTYGAGDFTRAQLLAPKLRGPKGSFARFDFRPETERHRIVDFCNRHGINAESLPEVDQVLEMMRLVDYLSDDVELNQALGRHIVDWISHTQTQKLLQPHDAGFATTARPWQGSKYTLIVAVQDRLKELGASSVHLAPARLRPVEEREASEHARDPMSSTAGLPQGQETRAPVKPAPLPAPSARQGGGALLSSFRNILSRPADPTVDANPQLPLSSARSTPRLAPGHFPCKPSVHPEEPSFRSGVTSAVHTSQAPAHLQRLAAKLTPHGVSDLADFLALKLNLGTPALGDEDNEEVLEVLSAVHRKFAPVVEEAERRAAAAEEEFRQWRSAWRNAHRSGDGAYGDLRRARWHLLGENRNAVGFISISSQVSRGSVFHTVEVSTKKAWRTLLYTVEFYIPWNLKQQLASEHNHQQTDMPRRTDYTSASPHIKAFFAETCIATVADLTPEALNALYHDLAPALYGENNKEMAKEEKEAEQNSPSPGSIGIDATEMARRLRNLLAHIERGHDDLKTPKGRTFARSRLVSDAVGISFGQTVEEDSQRLKSKEQVGKSESGEPATCTTGSGTEIQTLPEENHDMADGQSSMDLSFGVAPAQVQDIPALTAHGGLSSPTSSASHVGSPTITSAMATSFPRCSFLRKPWTECAKNYKLLLSPSYILEYY
ncbi:uncharacterized protein MYCFIDRAFT_84428 [Pseudocercospora fijiensis CIRAD86]|uniref:Uncharacterized protein n=1 Tax=Pseudocercospora fijiensis (strain CIRAD86) TaxID=383855 RepID=M3AH03_PSEFD|nr:uncharacterized protein MYCFIDRAFT_84428 [Pseudocercospora fijiensis CIRAD86]EME76767.1 hypothetical protein MYCFIDRAFT_84428 [Pseudocercospora fijiensis CIRAD86]